MKITPSDEVGRTYEQKQKMTCNNSRKNKMQPEWL